MSENNSVVVKPIHRIMAALVHAGRRTIEDVPVQDRESVIYVIVTEYDIYN